MHSMTAKHNHLSPGEHIDWNELRDWELPKERRALAEALSGFFGEETEAQWEARMGWPREGEEG